MADEELVGLLTNGKKFHRTRQRSYSGAGGTYTITVCHFGWPVTQPLCPKSSAIEAGYEPCSKCGPWR